MANKTDTKSNAKAFEELRQQEIKQRESEDAKRVVNRRYVGSKETLGIVPMLFYDLDNEKKERMYAELVARRKPVSEKVSADTDNVFGLVPEI